MSNKHSKLQLDDCYTGMKTGTVKNYTPTTIIYYVTLTHLVHKRRNFG